MPVDEPKGFVALVPAAGSGSRFGGRPKQLVEIHGRPLLAWTLDRLLACGAGEVLVALPEALAGEGLGSAFSDSRVRYLAGGETRQESVRICLEAAPGAAGDLVLVHDGVRPAVAERDVLATLAAAAETGAAILGRAVHDTVKRLEAADIVATIDRRTLFRAETPQVFSLEILDRAFAAALRDGFVATDEAALVERLEGVTIRAVEATAPNPKLTRPRDLAFVESLLEGVAKARA